jgi:hypothetical protein
VLRCVLRHLAGIFSREGAIVTAEKPLNGKHRIDHPLFKSYVEGRCDPSDLAWIARKRKSDPVFEAFFSAVELLSGAAGAERTQPEAGAAISRIHEIDDLLSLSFCGLVTKENAGRCLNTLVLSPIYFDKFLKKIAESVQRGAEKSASVSTAVTVKGDEEMLARIRDASANRGRRFQYGNVGFWSRLAGWARNLPSVIGPTVRRPVFAAAVMLLAAGIVWRLAFFNPGRQLPEFAVFNRTVPYPYDQSGLRGFDETLSGADEALFMRKLKLGMSDYVKWEFGQAAALFESEEAEASRLVHTPSMAAYVRDYYFYWGMSRLSVVRLKEPLSDNGRMGLGEAARLMALAFSTAEEHGLPGTDRELFFLGLAFGLDGRKTEACGYLKKIPADSRFIQDSRALLGFWLEKSR